MSGTIHVAREGRHIVVLEIDNPPLNVMGAQMRKVFLETLAGLEDDHDIRALVLTGRGRAFCSGDDLGEGKLTFAPGESFADLLTKVAGLRMPVIAAVNGYCIGGGLELALCCDIRLAADGAKFTCAGVNVGLMASVYSLPRLIGVARAKAMLLTGLPQDAETAERYGLVTGVYPQDRLRAEAITLAERIASRAPLSVEASKRFVDRALDLSPAEAAALNGRELHALVQSADHKEAVAAFREKRAPVFQRK
jgi:enoyl-CoA hydratase/carnithine racemase